MTQCYKNELERKEKPQEWKTSRTRMKEKTKRPTAKDLRPIALTNTSYKIFMSLLKDEIDDHIYSNDESKETQAGFTKGARIEDNLFILQYVVQESLKRKQQLIMTAVDFKKAYDSVKRETLIKVLMDYKVHPTIIEAVGEIYNEDKTTVTVGKDINKEISVTSGIRQGCTGSPTLFKLITYIIIKELETKGQGFENEWLKIGALFYADDGLILSPTIEDAERNIKILTDIGEKCGLEINKDKSDIIIYNMKEKPEEIAGIRVRENIKYLGVTLDDKKNMFKTQKKKMIENTRRLGNMAYSVINKSCNKLLMGKTYWKNIALPSILYASSVINMTESEIKEIQRIENSVGRQILGAPKYAPVCTLRGEIGMSTMKTRIIEGRLKYMKHIEEGNNELLKRIWTEIKDDGNNQWRNTTLKYMEETNITNREIQNLKMKEIKRKIRNEDTRQWQEEMENKVTLSIYKKWKKEIKEEQVYDNRPSSVIWYRARSNCLNLENRNRHQGGNTTCKLCNLDEENIIHFVLHCPYLQEIRNKIEEFQRPYQENEEGIIGHFLFPKNNINKKKEILYEMWRKREIRLNTIKKKQ